ncbi:MAG: FAD:protein FMN transferase [Clostridiales bacterium]|nr:FAD:protein FMN transferase [Candidatus Blautia equi]
MTDQKKRTAALALAGMLFTGTVSVQAEPVKYTNMGFAMNTIVTETIYSEGEDITSEILAILTSLDQKYLSWTAGDTEIGRINAGSGSLVETSPLVSGWLEQILEISERSEGALDPTMGQVISLWDIDGENPHIPAQEEINDALTHVGYEKVSIEDTGVTLEAGTTLNLGAEGKGIGSDLVMSYLKDQPEVTAALINLGASSMMTYGNKPDGSPWKVAITDPRDKDSSEYLGVVALGADEFLSTSGDYEKYFEEDGVRYHHIMDPATGAPARSGLMSVTVICDNGLTADALSTACFVLGEEKAFPLAESYGAELLLVGEDYTISMTPGMQSRFELMKQNYSFKAGTD